MCIFVPTKVKRANYYTDTYLLIMHQGPTVEFLSLFLCQTLGVIELSNLSNCVLKRLLWIMKSHCSNDVFNERNSFWCLNLVPLWSGCILHFRVCRSLKKELSEMLVYMLIFLESVFFILFSPFCLCMSLCVLNQIMINT